MSEISQVNLTAPPDEWAGREPALAAKAESSQVGLSVGLLVGFLLVALGGALWSYAELAQILRWRDAGPGLEQLARWQLTATGFAAASGFILLGFVLTGHRRVRQDVVRRWKKERGEWEMNLKDLQSRLSEKQKIETGLREQQLDLEVKFNHLARAHEEVQEELNRVRLAEEVFTYQRRELVRSKDVLELHVQARTQQLQKLQRAYELILNSAGEGICGLDIEGKVTFVNPAAAKMMGMGVADLVGRPARQAFPQFMGIGPADTEPRNGVQPTEVVATRGDGKSFGAEFLRTPIREGERVVGEVLLFKDITERKCAAETLARKAEELARSNAELEQFAFVASHDLQEPLRKIQAFGDRLKTKCAAVNLEEGRDYLERMQNAAARMQTLIFDLLTFSRVISRTEPFAPVDLQTVAREVIGDLEMRIEKTGGRVDVGELPAIEADALQMRQLLLNLIGNALKFHAPGTAPVVRVQGRILTAPPAPGEARAEIPWCVLSITDNGIGFDEKYLDRIFAVFQRLHGREEYEGTGIGLAVCRRIVDRHGGSITARSKPGEGATFLITIPSRQTPKSKGAP